MGETIPAQQFGPTSGGVTGVLGLIGCAAVAVAALADGVSDGSVRVALGAAAAAVVLWAYMLRPRVLIESGGTLLLRNAFADWRVPLAGIKVVRVRALLSVKTADDRQYDGVGAGRPVRQMIRGAGARGDAAGGFGFFVQMPPMSAPEPRTTPGRVSKPSMPDFVTEQILSAAERARLLGMPDGPGVRLYAVPELVALGVLLVALAVSFAF